MSSWEKGDLVWALLSPYTYWPAIYVSANDINTNALVRFIEEKPREALVKSVDLIKFWPIGKGALHTGGSLVFAMSSPFLRAAVAEANLISIFLKASRLVLLTIKSKSRNFKYGIQYCICLPNCKKNKSGMIFCARCTDWFHLSCLRMKAFPENPAQFRCIACRTIGITDEAFREAITIYNNTEAAYVQTVDAYDGD